MCGCGCACRAGWPAAWRWPAREDRIGWLQEYQRDLEQQAAEVAEEIRQLQEAQQSAS
jgi:predicted esterase